MDLKGEFISKAIEIAAGVFVGYITYVISAPMSDLAGMFGIMIGLTTTLVVALLIEYYRNAQEIRNTDLHIITLTEKIAERHKETSDLATILSYGITTIPREQVFDVLIQLLWRIDTGLLATNYIDPDEGWGRAYGDLYHEIQRSKVKVSKATINRVFIVDNQNEVDKLRSVMLIQKEAGVKVRVFFKKRLEATSVLKTAAATIETLDFDVFDSRYVWLTILDKNRKIKYGKIIFGKEACERYKRFHNHLFMEAKELK
ncbi:MAG: hypothetical protein JSV98_04335 [candidate division WOR-3 bacterium]|nr:MAG: hypothetical protein JSV98_04335 [candidate division WOR-3 bacterium]